MDRVGAHSRINHVWKIDEWKQGSSRRRRTQRTPQSVWVAGKSKERAECARRRRPGNKSMRFSSRWNFQHRESVPAANFGRFRSHEILPQLRTDRTSSRCSSRFVRLVKSFFPVQAENVIELTEKSEVRCFKLLSQFFESHPGSKSQLLWLSIDQAFYASEDSVWIIDEDEELISASQLYVFVSVYARSWK